MNLRSALEDSVLVCDGAMGTMLHAAGNALDQALPALVLSDPQLVRAIHDSYVDAGVDVIQTNTFGASRLRLSAYGYGERVQEINRAAVQIAREAADRAERDVLVAGSVSPAVGVRQRHRVPAAERAEALREQIAALADAGVDVILLETFGYLDELVQAVDIAAQSTDLPLIAQATFDTDGRTLSGHTPRELAAAAADLPLVALGTNCTLGPQRSLTVLRDLAEYTQLPLTVQPNAGLPRRLTPASVEYDIDSAYFVRYIRQLIDAGAALVGGCCGTTPTQLAAAVEVADEQRQRQLRQHAQAPAPARPSVVTTTTRTPLTAPLADSRHLLIGALDPPEPGAIDEAVEGARRFGEAGVGACWALAGSGSKARVSPIDLALHLRQQLGIETMATVTTWDRTIMALQADLLGAHALGVRRIVCETGAPPLVGDYPNIDGVWDVDSIGLIELMAGLNDGVDYYGLTLAAKTQFEIGARINPGSRTPEIEAARTANKISAGAQFLITRPVHEVSGLERLLATVDGRVPVLLTLQPLRGFAEAEYLAHEVPDVTIPASTLDVLERAGDSERQAGIELAAELAMEVADRMGGFVIPSAPDMLAVLSRSAGW